MSNERSIPLHDRPLDSVDKFDEGDWFFRYAYDYIYYKQRKNRKLSPLQFSIFGDIKFEEATIAKFFEKLQFFRHYNQYLETRFSWIRLSEEDSLTRIDEIKHEFGYFFPPDHGLKLLKYIVEHKDPLGCERDKKYFDYVLQNCDILDSMFAKQHCKEILDKLGYRTFYHEEDRGTVDIVLEINDLNEECSDDLAWRAECCFNNEYGYNTFGLLFMPSNIHIFKIPHIWLTVKFMMENPIFNYQYVLWGNVFLALFCHQPDFERTVRYFNPQMKPLSLFDDNADMIFG